MELNELLTAPGAALGAGLLTSVMKTLWLPGRFARQFVMLAAMALMVGATIANGGATGGEWFVIVVFAAPTAGLAAIAAYDNGIAR